MKLLYSTALLVVLATPAYATTVSALSGPIVYNISQSVTGSGTTSTLTGSLKLSNFDFSGANSVKFDVAIANTTPQGGLSASTWQSIRLVSFGFNTDPDATGVVDTSTVFNTSVDNNQPLPGFGKLDFCAFVNNCAGGSNGGLPPNTGESFSVTLSGFSSDITTLDIGIGADEQLATKWQTAFGSFHLATNPGGISPPPPPPPPPPPAPVAEPGSLAMLGTALLGLGYLKRTYARRRNRA